MLYEPHTPNSYRPEYNVLIRRFTDVLKATGPQKTKLGSAVSLIHPGQTLEQHKHPVTEFIYLINGQAAVWVEGHTQILNEGDIAVLPPNKLHHVSNTGAESFRLFSFWWSEDSEN